MSTRRSLLGECQLLPRFDLDPLVFLLRDGQEVRRPLYVALEFWTGDYSPQLVEGVSRHATSRGLRSVYPRER
jgi:hypothetical protein